MASISMISLTDVEASIGKENCFIYDCTTPGHYKRRHIPTAVFLDPFYHVSELPGDQSAVLIFYSYNSSCKRALVAYRLAKEMGYSNAYLMRAGLEGWLRKMAYKNDINSFS